MEGLVAVCSLIERYGEEEVIFQTFSTTSCNLENSRMDFEFEPFHCYGQLLDDYGIPLLGRIKFILAFQQLSACPRSSFM